MNQGPNSWYSNYNIRTFFVEADNEQIKDTIEQRALVFLTYAGASSGSYKAFDIKEIQKASDMNTEDWISRVDRLNKNQT